MKVKTILNDLLVDVTPNMHKVRRKSLEAVVTSALSGAELSVTSLGRNIDSKTTEKHQIKRSTRLCSNIHLYQERFDIYSKLSRRLIGHQKHPIILVDWSDLDSRKDLFLLRASVAIKGRSLTLLDDIQPLSLKEKPAIHQQFMARLKLMLPEKCKPIIVTDAGFRVPWFNLVRELGWDYVGRVRNKTFCLNTKDKDWHPVKDLYRQASSRPKSLGRYQMARRNPIESHMIIYKKKKQGRKDLIATGERVRRSKKSLSNASKEREPWLLATSLASQQTSFAKRIVKIYKSRMQIEESFRDLKTGLNFNKSNARKKKRIEVLILVSVIAQFILFLLGITIKLLNKHRRYQASSIQDQNILSYQFIGLRAFRDKYLILSKDNFTAGFNKVQTLIDEVGVVG